MLKEVWEMLTNVGNWRAEMSENVGRKCQGMWRISPSNVIECWQMLNPQNVGKIML